MYIYIYIVKIPNHKDRMKSEKKICYFDINISEMWPRFHQIAKFMPFFLLKKRTIRIFLSF